MPLALELAFLRRDQQPDPEQSWPPAGLGHGQCGKVPAGACWSPLPWAVLWRCGYALPSLQRSGQEAQDCPPGWEPPNQNPPAPLGWHILECFIQAATAGIEVGQEGGHTAPCSTPVVNPGRGGE